MQRASERCLSISEILEMIMVCLHDDGRGRASVARMARATKTVYSVAVAVLWRRIQGIRPFMSTVGGYDFKRDSRNSAGAVWVRTDSKANTGIERLAFYTSHVKTLVWHYNYDGGYLGKYSVDEFLQWLSQSTPPGLQLFPHLRLLKFAEDEENYDVLYHFLLAPALEELHLNANALAAEPVFKNLHQYCPRLRCLRLTAPSNSRRFPPPVYKSRTVFPLSSTCLSEFDSHDFLTIEAVQTLSLIPSLRHLRIALSTRAQQSLPLANKPFLQSLETLRIFTPHLNDATLALFKALSSPCLRAFELVVRARSSDQLNEQLVASHAVALSEAPFKRALRSVTFFLKYETPATPGGDIGIRVIQPLLRCEGLLTLQVFAQNIVLDMAACQFIAGAFSHLEMFAFTDNYRNDVDAGTIEAGPFAAVRAAPLEGLLAITKACRRLRSLHISVQIKSPEQLVIEDAAVLPTIERGNILPRYESEEKDIELRHLVNTYLGKLLPRCPPSQSQVTSIIPRAH